MKKKKIKARRRRDDFRSSEEVGKEFKSNNCDISFSNVFNWPEYGILSFEERISRELCSIAIRNTTNTGIVQNVVCRAVLELRNETENVAGTEGTDFLCKLWNL